MKRTIILLLMLTLLAGCGRETAVTEGTEVPTVLAVSTEATEPKGPAVPVGDEDTFMLSHLPDIGEYGDGAAKRWYEDYTPELIPRSDYGPLIPYAGKRTKYDDAFYPEALEGPTFWKYGLCTEDGVIVTDPVYDSVTFTDDGHYLLTSLKYTDKSYHSTSYVVAADGSTAVKLADGNSGYLAEGVYYVSRGAEDHYYRCDGHELTPLDPGDMENINSAWGYITADVNNAQKQVLLDGNLQKISGAHNSVKPACEGCYIFSEGKDSNTRWGVAKSDGTCLLPPEYYDIEYIDDCFYATDADSLSVYSKDLKLISDTLIPGDDPLKIVGESVLRRSDYTSTYYTFSGEPIECDSLYAPNLSDLMYMQKDGGTYICDRRANALAFAAGMTVRSAERIGDDFAVYDNDSAKRYFLDAETGNVTPVDDYIKGAYMLKDGYGYAFYGTEGRLLFTCSGMPAQSETHSGRLFHYADGGYLYTADSEGNVIIKFPDDTYK